MTLGARLLLLYDCGDLKRKCKIKYGQVTGFHMPMKLPTPTPFKSCGVEGADRIGSVNINAVAKWIHTTLGRPSVNTPSQPLIDGRSVEDITTRLIRA